MSTILKFDFQKRQQLRFTGVNYLNYKGPIIFFACDNYICPKTRGNKNKQWTHSTPQMLLFKSMQKDKIKKTKWEQTYVGERVIRGAQG